MNRQDRRQASEKKTGRKRDRQMRRWPGDETDEAGDEAGKRGNSEKRRQVGVGSNTGGRQEWIQAEEKTGRSRDRWKRARQECRQEGKQTGMKEDTQGNR